MYYLIILTMLRYIVFFILSGSGWGIVLLQQVYKMNSTFFPVMFLQAILKGLEEENKPNLAGYLVIAITALAGTAIFLYKMKDKTDKELKTAYREHAEVIQEIQDKHAGLVLSMQKENSAVLAGLVNKLNADQAERADKYNKLLLENTNEQRNVQEALRSIKTIIELKLAV